MNRFASRLRCYAGGLPLLLGIFAAGCGGGGGLQVSEDHFFPLPPDPPRVQFLRSFNGSMDMKGGADWLDYLAGAEKAPEYVLTKPFSVATWKGRIYVTDSYGVQAVNVFDLENERFYVLGAREGIAKIKKPIHIFIDEAGYKYISDLMRKQVVVYGPDDRYVRAYGNGRTFLPVAAAAYGSEVYVLDGAKDEVESDIPGQDPFEVRRDQVLVLDKVSGRELRRIGRHEKGKNGFCFAGSLTVDRKGNLYVSDSQNYRVVKMDSQGNVTCAFGVQGRSAGQFAFMKGIAVDRNGLIYVVDAGFQAVQVFDNAGNPLFAMGGPRAPVGALRLPAGICVDYHNLEYFLDLYSDDFIPDYLVMVVNQYSSRNRLGVYAYGKRVGFEYPSEQEVVTLEEASSEPLWRMDVVHLNSPGSTGGRLPNAAAQRQPRS